MNPTSRRCFLLELDECNERKLGTWGSNSSNGTTLLKHIAFLSCVVKSKQPLLLLQDFTQRVLTSLSSARVNANSRVELRVGETLSTGKTECPTLLSRGSHGECVSYASVPVHVFFKVTPEVLPLNDPAAALRSCSSAAAFSTHCVAQSASSWFRSSSAAASIVVTGGYLIIVQTGFGICLVPRLTY
ncbi:hypothetical protein E3N88_15979 [Mikania micrantha]|uniref:Uncharacterized protein n=1 Tax=Mikania micrantha TaxID=192012 RepID=A0A5N6NX61_9ASTR|nr:hypothetical protein E3N88_15979 [Mikania micrantha]